MQKREQGTTAPGQTFIPAGEDLLEEIPEAVLQPITVFEPAANWNNNMLAGFKKALANPEAPIERLRELIQLQKDLQKENARLEFNAAMSRVQQKIVPVVKNKYNKQTESYYADLNAICEMVTPIYSAEGFSVSYGTGALDPSTPPVPPNFTRTIQTLAHHAGFERVYYIDLPIDNAGKDGKTNKTIMHGTKSSHSYARNILITMAFNIAQKGVDDDGNAAGGRLREDEVERISEGQHGQLVDLLSEKNLSPKWLASTLRVDDLEELEADRFEVAVNTIAKQRAQPAKGGRP